MVFPKFLRIVVTTRTELLEINGTTIKRKHFGRTDVKFVEILARALGFSYELLSTVDDEIGRQLPNGSWTGQMGMIERNETDMVVSIIALTTQRLQAADFSYPYHRVRITYATRKPEYTPSPDAFLWPFSGGVWMLTIASLFMMPLVFSMLLSKKHTLVKLALVAISTLLHQDVDVPPKKAHEYPLLLFWKFGTMFLTYGYTGILLSFLTFPPLTGIRTIPELAAGIAKGKYECFGLPGSFLLNILPKSTDPRVKLIGDNLKQNQNKASRDIDAMLTKKRKSPRKPVFVGGEDFVLPLNMKYFISEDEFFPALRSVALQKGFCCRSELDEVISYVWASGIYKKFVSEGLFMETLKAFRKGLDDDEPDVKALSVAQFEGSFHVLIFGHFLGIVDFVFEILIGKKYLTIPKFPGCKRQSSTSDRKLVVKRPMKSKRIKVTGLKTGIKRHYRRKGMLECDKKIIRIIY